MLVQDLDAEAHWIGELVTVIPNHLCVIANLHDRVYAARQGGVETFYEVAARGKLQ
jgi:D-serine deaminase-like pyridoxal phosphate-dependent protein